MIRTKPATPFNDQLWVIYLGDSENLQNEIQSTISKGDYVSVTFRRNDGRGYEEVRQINGLLRCTCSEYKRGMTCRHILQIGEEMIYVEDEIIPLPNQTELRRTAIEGVFNQLKFERLAIVARNQEEHRAKYPEYWSARNG